MPAKRYMTYAAMAFVVFYVIREPGAPARSVGSAAGGLASAADSLTALVTTLA
ncbi:hypothetical protein [Actinomadura fibrosa]|uniref:MFS transporter n=1 Tax=Actinomadura fibrosa TaxID=111802 RepID=A0ABW2XH17_9ACTN|nr:hypothetical protein [Actinomadura fibrosa]